MLRWTTRLWPLLTVVCLSLGLAGCQSSTESISTTNRLSQEADQQQNEKLEEESKSAELPVQATDETVVRNENTDTPKETTTAQAPKPSTDPKPNTEKIPTSTNPSAPMTSEQVVDSKKQMVMISIKGDEEVGIILAATEVTFESGESVLDILKKVTKEKKIQMEYRGTGPIAYVEGIDNLYEFDRGPKSGWMYRVNGSFGKKSAGDVQIKPNDQIEWIYTLDLGKDVQE
ncbi:DUF4430 domain-containing protein [Ammoniphilus sp. CFH 90114]|uniref:DUF4430 domain-containing protein n=1 Tax=Ammoniphilus sp. CFH 90114 TaxID=2493665 RepID=UPI00100E0DCE|nr:DUF4430 domain-containing protein [Ammoniphilus sp. CFH 90114]RXT06467.1 DUF4430 domain-containing protein [Ammoniphilus sp. CFH 90114]